MTARGSCSSPEPLQIPGRVARSLKAPPFMSNIEGRACNNPSARGVFLLVVVAPAFVSAKQGMIADVFCYCSSECVAAHA